MSVAKTKNFSIEPYMSQPFQIMPTRQRFINLDNYPISPKLSPSAPSKNILIHTGYDFNIFSEKGISVNSYAKQLLKNALEFKQRINGDFVLIHGPDTESKLKYFIAGLGAVKYVESKFHDVTHTRSHICIEMPAFKSDLFTVIDALYRNKPTKNERIFTFINEYLTTCINNNFDIVLDTAHLYANGLTTDQIIKLCKDYYDHYKYIHLNGNCKDIYKPDEHTIFDPEGLYKSLNFKQNLILNSDKLLTEIAKLNKICISEEKCNSVDYYKYISNKYGFKLVDDKIIINSVV